MFLDKSVIVHFDDDGDDGDGDGDGDGDDDDMNMITMSPKQLKHSLIDGNTDEDLEVNDNDDGNTNATCFKRNDVMKKKIRKVEKNRPPHSLALRGVLKY